jgi:hypothetical protein
MNSKRKTAYNKRYKTLGFKWICERSAPHQYLLSGDSDVLRNPQRFHTADRWQQAEKNRENRE